MKIALLGDIAFFGKYSLNNNPNLYEYFKDISNFLNKYDYVIGNLETPFVNGQKEFGAKSAHICTDIQNIDLLKYLNISIVNLANNHIFDYGQGSFDITKNILSDNKIQYFGIENKQVYINEDENKIALSGFCCMSSNPMGANKINLLIYPDIEKTLLENKKMGYNNILSIHAGQEHINYPNYDHIRFARKLSEIVPYVYYGHHPHVVQGLEQFNHSLLLYSLGNFCFDDVYTTKSKKPLIKQTDNNKTGLIIELEYKENQLINYKPISIYMGESKLIINYNIGNDKLQQYSNQLLIDCKEYCNKRNILWQEYIYNRKKSTRNLMWYLKHLNINSIRMIVNARRNSKLYKKDFTSYLN